ncbi:MAG: S8 family peptidase [Myxococcota bacterium]
MGSRYSLPHLSLSERIVRHRYKSRKGSGGSGWERDRGQHGRRLREQFDSALREFNAQRPHDPGLPETEGAFIEVELGGGAKVEVLEKRTKGLLPGAVNKDTTTEHLFVGLFVSGEGQKTLDGYLREYQEGPLTEKGNVPKKSFAEPIEDFRSARLETYWTDVPDTLPENPGDTIWWQAWVERSSENRFYDLCLSAGARAADQGYHLRFPEVVVIPVWCSRSMMERILFAEYAVLELRRANDSPAFFLDHLNRDEQVAWSTDLAERTVWPHDDVPAVCLFDSGVNRGHSLIEPALSAADLMSVNEAWGVDDSGAGHGTAMAALALHGDLWPRLAESDTTELEHRVESVKILPPNELPKTEESFFAPLTKQAVALSEINQPERPRVYCMSVTNSERSGEIPSAWSAALDQDAAGVSYDDGSRPRRLFFVATGNAPNHIEVEKLRVKTECPIEDPAQAWNVITVGGYTDRVDVQEGIEDRDNYVGYVPFHQAGQLSPHTRTSEPWARGKSAYKPDIVMEAGNRALEPGGRHVVDLPSLGLLTVGVNPTSEPLAPFNGTSAAAALAARLGAQLMARHPDYWPETIRALIVHSAEWTEAMLRELKEDSSKTNAMRLLRRFGYGVPSFERAASSATNHLALLTQAEIQPFAPGNRFNECHVYELPWPRDALERLGENDIELKVTLSYFVEPNPGPTSSVEPARYRSYGLRFDLQRDEDHESFLGRVNAEAGTKPKNGPESDQQWRFGTRSISAGSLHSDVWTGPAAYLLTKNLLCIYPVVGWWRSRAKGKIVTRRSRYALVVSLKSASLEHDLYTPISLRLRQPVEIAILHQENLVF